MNIGSVKKSGNSPELLQAAFVGRCSYELRAWAHHAIRLRGVGISPTLPSPNFSMGNNKDVLWQAGDYGLSAEVVADPSMRGSFLIQIGVYCPSTMKMEDDPVTLTLCEHHAIEVTRMMKKAAKALRKLERQGAFVASETELVPTPSL